MSRTKRSKLRTKSQLVFDRGSPAKSWAKRRSKPMLMPEKQLGEFGLPRGCWLSGFGVAIAMTTLIQAREQ